MLCNADLSCQISGVSISRNGPKISHLLFSDENLIFCKANAEECCKVLNILQRYEEASGQQLNLENTTMFLCKNTSGVVRETLKALLGVPDIKSYENYLGLPSFIGSEDLRGSPLHKLRNGFIRNLTDGRKRFCGGREILVKVIAQEIPRM
jgi:hypothetical protein